MNTNGLLATKLSSKNRKIPEFHPLGNLTDLGGFGLSLGIFGSGFRENRSQGTKTFFRVDQYDIKVEGNRV